MDKIRLNAEEKLTGIREVPDAPSSVLAKVNVAWSPARAQDAAMRLSDIQEEEAKRAKQQIIDLILQCYIMNFKLF